MKAAPSVSPLHRILLALCIGAAGGALFRLLHLPLPWMLGALATCIAASVGGLPVLGPSRLRPPVVAVIGVLLGARFTPDVLAQAAVWWVSLSLLLVYLVAVGLVVVPFYRWIGGFDWTTAYFSGMPGGLTEMIETAEAKGARVDQVVLAHSLRIAVTIGLIAFWFRVVLGHHVGTGPALGAPLPGLADAAVLVATLMAGVWLGRVARFPAPDFLGPLAVSAVLHGAGLTESAPPGVLVNGAQIVLGTVLGCRFVGIPARTLIVASGLSLGATLLTLLLAVGAARVMGAVAGIGADQALLALAPGGLTEMGLIALAVGGDAAFVALHHVVRILVIIVAAPLAYAALAGRRR